MICILPQIVKFKSKALSAMYLPLRRQGAVLARAIRSPAAGLVSWEAQRDFTSKTMEFC